MPSLFGFSGWLWLLAGLGAFLGVPWLKRQSQAKATATQARELAVAEATHIPHSGPTVPVYPQDYGLPIISSFDQEGRPVTPLLVSGGGRVVTQAGQTHNLSPGDIYIIPNNRPTEGN